MLNEFKKIKNANNSMQLLKLSKEDLSDIKKLDNDYLINKQNILKAIEQSNKLYEIQCELNKDITPYKCEVFSKYVLNDIVNIIMKQHILHISRVYEYFIKKYNVELDQKEFSYFFKQEEPVFSVQNYIKQFKNLTEDEIQNKIKGYDDLYKEMIEEYKLNIIIYNIKYQDIINDIFN